VATGTSGSAGRFVLALIPPGLSTMHCAATVVTKGIRIRADSGLVILDFDLDKRRMRRKHRPNPRIRLLLTK